MLGSPDRSATLTGLATHRMCVRRDEIDTRQFHDPRSLYDGHPCPSEPKCGGVSTDVDVRRTSIAKLNHDKPVDPLSAWIHQRKGQRMPVRGIRGAISVPENNSDEMLTATRELLTEILRANELTHYEDIVSAIFTTTADLTAAFPAEAARGLGMNHVPLLCASEIEVPHGMPRCIRVLLHVNTDRTQQEIVHVYLRDAKKLRPDMDSAQ